MSTNIEVKSLYFDILDAFNQRGGAVKEDENTDGVPSAILANGNARGILGVITTTAGTLELLWQLFGPNLRPGTNLTAMKHAVDECVTIITRDLALKASIRK